MLAHVCSGAPQVSVLSIPIEPLGTSDPACSFQCTHTAKSFSVPLLEERPGSVDDLSTCLYRNFLISHWVLVVRSLSPRGRLPHMAGGTDALVLTWKHTGLKPSVATKKHALLDLGSQLAIMLRQGGSS